MSADPDAKSAGENARPIAGCTASASSVPSLTCTVATCSGSAPTVTVAVPARQSPIGPNVRLSLRYVRTSTADRPSVPGKSGSPGAACFTLISDSASGYASGVSRKNFFLEKLYGFGVRDA